MRKVDDGEQKKEKEKIMLFTVAANVVASRLPECQPIGRHTPLANTILPALRALTQCLEKPTDR